MSRLLESNLLTDTRTRLVRISLNVYFQRDKSDESENSDDSSEEEEEKPKNVKPSHKPIDQKTLKKTLAKTNNKLQAFKRGKGGNKFNRKTTKSKRDKHYHPMRKVDK